MPDLPAVGQTFTVDLDMVADGQVQGLKIPLLWDDEVVEFIGFQGGPLLADQGGQSLVLSCENGVVDIGAFETFIPENIYVSNSGNDGDDGMSWARAVLTIQKGIDLAVTEYTTVWVADGTYTGTGNMDLYMNGKAITLKL